MGVLPGATDTDKVFARDLVAAFTAVDIQVVGPAALVDRGVMITGGKVGRFGKFNSNDRRYDPDMILADNPRMDAITFPVECRHCGTKERWRSLRRRDRPRIKKTTTIPCFLSSGGGQHQLLVGFAQIGGVRRSGGSQREPRRRSSAGTTARPICLDEICALTTSASGMRRQNLARVISRVVPRSFRVSRAFPDGNGWSGREAGLEGAHATVQAVAEPSAR